jgi:predicted 3-demethylubiquinone-9 3-methyltransferase (glyoxalase superfamily)
MLQRITPFLWFDSQAEEAATFYVSLFPNSRLGTVLRYGEAAASASGRPEGSVLTVEFELEGQGFVAMNAGPAFQFTPAISFMVNCDTQAEVDRLWEALSEGGKTIECGWLTDKFGVTWQITPTKLMGMLQDPDPARAERVMRAMMGMVKLDIGVLERAYEGPNAA